MLKGIEFIREKSRAFKTSPLEGEVGAPLRVRGNNKQAGGTSYRWFASALNVILRRYSLPEVPWRRIHNVIAYAMSICVAVGNKVMDSPAWHSLWGVPPKYDVVSSMQRGRSMIEMLGVLAIIAVLSVGGIAGYSKAMEKYKLNKALDDYKMLVFGLVEYKSDVEKLQNTPGSVGLADFIAAVNLLPADWKHIDSHQFNDPYGNFLRIAYRNTNAENEQSRILMDIYLGGWQSNDKGKNVSKNFSNDLCVALYKDLIFPLHSLIFRAGNYIPSGATTSMYGDAYCTEGRRCLKNMTVTDFYNACNLCPKNEDVCTLTLGF